MKFALSFKSKGLAFLALVATSLCAFFTFGALSVTRAADDAPRVVASFSVSGANDLWGGAERIADVMNYGDLVKGVRGLVNMRIKTDVLDPAKPLGVIAATNGDEVAAFGYLPLLKPEEFDETALNALKEKIVEIDENLFKGDYFVVDGALVIGKESQKELIAATLASVGSAPSADETTLTRLQINVDAAPQEFIEAGAALIRQKLAELAEGQSDDELQSVDRALDNYSELVASLKSIEWTLAVDADSNLVSDIVVTPRPETELTASFAKTAQTPTRWNALAETPNAILFGINAGDAGAANFKGDVEQIRQAIHENLTSALDALKDDPENLEVAKEIMQHVENALVAEVASETYDSGIVISATPVTLAFASCCAAPNELQAAAEKLVERLLKSKEASSVAFTKEDVEGYSVLNLTVPLNDVSDDLPEFFRGKSFCMRLGFSSDALLLVATLDEGDAKSAFERVARGSHETAPQPNESFLDCSALAKALQSVLATFDDVRQQASDSIASFANAEDARIVFTKSYNGGTFEMKTTIRSGFFKALGDVVKINLVGGGNGDEGQDIDDLFDDEE